MMGTRRTAAWAAALTLALAGCATGAQEREPATGAATGSSVRPSADPATTMSGEESATEDAAGEASADAPGATDDARYAFTADTLDGATLDGESLLGRDVILWFWAPWCPTCMVEGRDYVSEAIAQMPDGVELIGVAGRSDDVPAMEEFLDFTGTGDATHVIDLDGEIWDAFGVLVQPAFIFHNDDGQERQAGAGLTDEDILEQAQLLAEG